jgi:hypothetical protein
VETGSKDGEENPMRNVLRVGGIVAAFALTAWIGVVALAEGSSTPTPSSPTTTATTPPSPTGVDDVKGNCDEAEHLNDPECRGVTAVPEDHLADDEQGDDINDDHGDADEGEGEGDDHGHDDEGEGGGNDHGDDDQGDDDQGDDELVG